MTHVLVSGAGFAGAALAFWLRRAGVEVTVVERSADGATRGGPIDLRGAAVDVIERMGLLDEVRAARTGTRRITIVDARDRAIANLDAGLVDDGTAARAVEIPRGDLRRILWDAVRDEVTELAEDTITDLTEHAGGVDVTFRSAAPRTVDLVVGADGLHSTVRRLAFGPESGYRRDLGRCFATFTVPNTLGLHREAVLHNTPGRTAVLYAVRDEPRLLALLSFTGPTPTLDHHDTAAWRRLFEWTFAGHGWRVPEMLEHLRRADEVYIDTVSQIRMPHWTTRRVALVGDAAYAPSFLSGQGTSLAVVGAYVLACEIASGNGVGAYEERMREFAARNQALADNEGWVISPATRGQLALRNTMVRAAPLLRRVGIRRTDPVADAAEAITLPPFPATRPRPVADPVTT